MARYKSHDMQRCYETALKLAANPESEFYYQGEPRRGAGHRCAFWDGYYGKWPTANVVPRTLSAAFYAAGKEWARRQRKMLKASNFSDMPVF